MILMVAPEQRYRHCATTLTADVLSWSVDRLDVMQRILLLAQVNQTRRAILEHRRPWCFYYFFESESVRQHLFVSTDKVSSVQ